MSDLLTNWLGGFMVYLLAKGTDTYLKVLDVLVVMRFHPHSSTKTTHVKGVKDHVW